MDYEYAIENDGLTIPEVGAWAEDKHRLVSLYSTLFSSGMKNKWSKRIYSKRIYIELYAGAGYSRIRGTSKLILGSPLHALQLKDRFDKYVFCDESRENIHALKTRAERIAPGVDIAYVRGNCNQSVDKILAAIPKGSTQNTVLSLCFADPFDLSLEFATIRALANARFVDFLVLLALGMDANRNYEYYLRDDSDKIDKFLGSNNWRMKWKAAQWDAVKFTRFLADEFTNSMANLAYIPPPYYSMKEVRSYEKNLPLYRLVLFSRNERAYKYWDEVLKYSSDQKSFWE